MQNYALIGYQRIYLRHVFYNTPGWHLPHNVARMNLRYSLILVGC